MAAVSVEIRQAALQLSPGRRPTLNKRKRELAVERLSQCTNLCWCTGETLGNVPDKAVSCVGGILLFLVFQFLFLKWRKYKGAHPVASLYASRGVATYGRVAGRVHKFYDKGKHSLLKKYFRFKLWCIVYYYLTYGKAKRTWSKCKNKVVTLATKCVNGFKSMYLNMAVRVYHYAPTLKVSGMVILMYLILSGDVEPNPGPKNGPLTLRDMRTIQPALWDARPKWYNIGIQLGCEVSDLDAIRASNNRNTDECMTDMLATWLRKGISTPTWTSIVEALQSPTVNLMQMAEKIVDKYLSSDPKEESEDSHKTDHTKCHNEQVSQGIDEAVVAETKTFQHIREFQGLSDEEKDGLEMRLERESENIKLSFHTLCNKFFDSLDEQQISVKKLVRYLKGLKALKSASSPKQASVLQSYEDVLESIDDVEKVKDVIEENSSFFDFRSLEYMIENAGQENDKKRLEKYKDDFGHYIKRRIFECPIEVGSTHSSNSTELLVKVESDYDKLVELKQFQCQLSFVLEVSIHVLRLSSVKDGCIQLIFLIPNLVQEAVFPLSPEQEAALTELGVVKLLCGDYHFPHEDSDGDDDSQVGDPPSGDGGGTKSSTTNGRVHPPDKGKFEQETAEINHQIKDLEAKLRAAQADSKYQEIVGDLNKFQADLMEMEKMRGINKTEVRGIEDRLKNLGEEVMKKKNEASSLLAGMSCNSEVKIDEMISALRGQILTRQLSDSDKRKYRHEIDTLEKSKQQLREFTLAKEAAEKMRTEQDELRKKRDSYYHRSRELKEKEMKIKDKMTDLKKAFENAKERKREMSTQKDIISKEINALYDRRRQLLLSFRSQQSAYQEERRRIREEEEKKREEDRQAHKEAKFKRKLDQKMMKAVHYDEDVVIARALISHLQTNIGWASCSPDYLGNEGDYPSSSSTNLDVSERESAAAGGSAVVGSVAGMRDSAIDQKPGEFLRKKDTEEVLVPAKWTVIRRKSKLEKKISTVPKRLNFNPAIFHQFSRLGIQPPSSHMEIPSVISRLQEKLTFLEMKSRANLSVPAYSEAGDSGVGGMTDISQAQSVATSQEDLHLITVSPNTSCSDLKHILSSPTTSTSLTPHQLQHDEADLSDNESSQTVIEDDESSTPRSNSSMVAAYS